MHQTILFQPNIEKFIETHRILLKFQEEAKEMAGERLKKNER